MRSYCISECVGRVYHFYWYWYGICCSVECTLTWAALPIPPCCWHFKVCWNKVWLLSATTFHACRRSEVTRQFLILFRHSQMLEVFIQERLRMASKGQFPSRDSFEYKIKLIEDMRAKTQRGVKPIIRSLSRTITGAYQDHMLIDSHVLPADLQVGRQCCRFFNLRCIPGSSYVQWMLSKYWLSCCIIIALWYGGNVELAG